MDGKSTLIETFVNHRLAANLTMVMMLMAGVWALTNIHIGLNPEQTPTRVEISIVWRGASAEDVEKLITDPIEQQIRTLPRVKTLRSSTQNTVTNITVEMEKGVDIQKAVDDIKQRVSQIRSFPPDIEPPEIRQQDMEEHVASVFIKGQGSIEELIPLARRLETDLLNKGADRTDFFTLPKQEIAIQIPSQTLFELELSLNELGRELTALSQDSPGGTIGTGQMSRQIRSLDQRRDTAAFEDLPILSSGTLIRLGDIATITKRPIVDFPYSTIGGEPVAQMQVRRNLETDSLESARQLQDWVAQTQATLPAGVTLALYSEAWVFIRDEINLIVENGLTGLVLVVLALLIFLQVRVAFWVMVGIPVTFAAALLAFYYLQGSLNVISLIAIVMALGIVVDDAIVVGEESLTQFQRGKSPSEAAIDGARRMFGPVLASSLTTLCAFLPLLLSNEETILPIPLMMACVIAASLIECFLVLPGHMKHAFEHARDKPPGAFRVWFNSGFESFRENRFRPLVRLAMNNRRLVIGSSGALFIIMISLWISGWIKMDNSLNINFDQIRADVQFTGGTSDADRDKFLLYLEAQLRATDEQFGGDNLVMFATNYNTAVINSERKSGSQYAAIWLEMISPEKRNVDAEKFADAWYDRVTRSHVVDALTIKKTGRWWGDFAILLKGADVDTLKLASEEVIADLGTLTGVRNLHDDLPYGKEQWIFELTTEGRSLGLTTTSVGNQLRAAYDGQRIQIFQQEQSELEVRLMLPESERTDLSRLGQFPIKTPGGDMMPLSTVATWRGKRGVDVIKHHGAQQTIKISGDVDLDVISGREVVAYFDENLKSGLLEKYGIKTDLDDKSAAEQDADGEFLIEFMIVLSLIYIVLAWIFSSYTWPLAIMAAIPLGLTGALIGHFILGMHIGPMSMLGLFTLTGIIVNDSIILVSAYKNLVEDGVEPQQAIEDAVVSRFRAVILTSLTTVAGLFPLMLEQAPIAAMFTPLAVAICFGMAYGTILVLLVIPALLSSVITVTDWIQSRGRDKDHHGIETTLA